MRWIVNILMFLVLVSSGLAQPLPEGMRDVDVMEKPDAQLPLDLKFTDEMGGKITLRETLLSGKPAILQLGYFGCPMLCDAVSQGMLRSLQEMDLNVGQDFNVIYVSFDPRETKIDAYQKKRTFVERYGRSGSAAGWNLLVCDEATAKQLADIVGFKYKWIEESRQFSHPAVLMVITPEGHVSRYLYGVEFPKQTLQLSLVEASQGRIGTTVDRVLMLCFRYDPNVGKYTFAAVGLMRVGGVVTVIALGTVLIRLFFKERRAAHGMK